MCTSLYSFSDPLYVLTVLQLTRNAYTVIFTVGDWPWAGSIPYIPETLGLQNILSSLAALFEGDRDNMDNLKALILLRQT